MRKSMITMMFALCMMFLMMPLTAKADDPETSGSCGESVTWAYEDGTLTISGTGEMKDYYGTGAPWHSFYDSLTTVVIENGITHIGEHAFDSCTSLNSVDIPDSITSIGNSVFSGCSSLSSIDLPDSVMDIEEYAFYDCSSLSSINIPEGVTGIGYSAFANCSSLSSIDLPEGVISIEEYAFYGCSSLSSITIPEGVTSILDSVFENCTSLIYVEIPESVTSIGNSSFSYCSSLSSITIPEGVTSIMFFAFSDCSSLSTIEIPNSMEVIGNFAFDYCDNLGDIYFKGTEEEWNNVAGIGSAGIPYTTIIHFITNPDPVTSIILSESKITLKAGETKALHLTSIPEDPDIDNRAEWTSSDSSIASVDAAGLVKGEKEGVAVITASCDGLSVKCIVIVSSPDITNIVLSKVNINMNSGGKCTLVASFLPIGFKAKVTWSSMNTEVATVSSSGVITAGTPGTTTIKVSAQGLTKSCTVKVKARLTGIAISSESMSMHTGDNETITVTFMPAYTTDDTSILYSSEDTDVAVVDSNGKVTAVSTGSTRIIVQVGNRKKICRVEVI